MFLKLRGGSLGLTLGLQTLHSVSVLQVGACSPEFCSTLTRPVASGALAIAAPSALKPPLAPPPSLQTEQQVKEFVRDHASLSLDATMPSAYVDPLAHDEPVIKTLKWAAPHCNFGG